MALLRAQLDSVLTEVSNGIFQELTDFGAERFLTPVGVKIATGRVGKYGTNHLRIHANAMGGRGEAPRVSLVTRDVATTYQIENHGLEGILTMDDYENVEMPFDAEEDEVAALTHANLVAKERALAVAMGATAAALTQNTTLTGSSQFSDLANSDPISVFKTARAAIRTGCGFYPDTALMDAEVYETLKIHPMLWERLGFKYNQSGELTEANILSALSVERLVLVKGVYDSSSQGQTASLAAIWGKDIFFAKCPSNPKLRQQSLGYHVFRKRQGPRSVYKYAINNPAEAVGIQCRDDYDMLLSDVTAGYAIYAAIA